MQKLDLKQGADQSRHPKRIGRLRKDFVLFHLAGSTEKFLGFRATGGLLLVYFTVLIGDRNPLSLLGLDVPFDFRFVSTLALLGFSLLFRIPAPKVHFVPGFYGLIAAAGTSWAAGMLFLNEAGSRVYLDILFILVVGFFTFLFGSDLGPSRLPRWFWWALITPLGVIFMYSIVQGPDSAGYFSGPSMGTIFYGWMMGTGFITLFFLGKDRNSNIYIAMSFIFLFGAVLSASRGAILALFLTTVIFLITVSPSLQLYSHSVKILLLGVGIFWFAPVCVSLYEFLTNKVFGIESNRGRFSFLLIDQIFQTFTTPEESPLPIYTSGRWEIWMETLHRISSPVDLLFGVGSSSVFVSFGQSHPHNLFLSFLLAGGLLSLVPFLLLIWRVSFSMFESSEIAQRIPAGLSMFWLLSALLSGSFGDSTVLFYFLSIALLSSQRRATRNFSRRMRPAGG